jgi:branched-subunit amino acid aminotransferase/4-amino-4-deoxychorismate lyase
MVGDPSMSSNSANLQPCDFSYVQVLYVLQDGLPGGGLVGESGAMNVFFLLQENGMMELITPPLEGLILPGVTRDTVLAIARGFGNIKVSERNLRFDEVFVSIFHHVILTSTMQVKDVHLLMWFYGLKNFRVERESLIYQKFLSCIYL